MIDSNFGNLKLWQKLACIITLLGGFQFILLTFIAMLFYPDGYSFTGDYFSNLGTTINVKTGSPNEVSRLLFLIACVIAGACLIPFWIVMPTLFTEFRLIKYISMFGSIIGTISSFYLMGVGIFAEDTHYFLHSTSAKSFFLFFILAIIIYSLAILLNSNYPKIYAYLGIIFTTTIISCLYIFRNSIQINIITQKIIVYGFCIWVLFQISKIWKHIGISINYRRILGSLFKKKIFK